MWGALTEFFGGFTRPESLWSQSQRLIEQADARHRSYENISRIERKNIIFEMYRKHFSSMSGISFQVIDGNTSPSNWMMAIRVDGVTCYEESSRFLGDHGIETRPMFYPISCHKHLGEYADPEEEKVSNKLNRECIILPSFPDLREKEVLYIIESVGKLARKKQNYIS